MSCSKWLSLVTNQPTAEVPQTSQASTQCFYMLCGSIPNFNGPPPHPSSEYLINGPDSFCVILLMLKPCWLRLPAKNNKKKYYIWCVKLRAVIYNLRFETDLSPMLAPWLGLSKVYGSGLQSVGMQVACLDGWPCQSITLLHGILYWNSFPS